MRTVPIVLTANGRSMRVHALLDDASSHSYVEEAVADYLGLDGPEEIVAVRVINGQVVNAKAKVVDCKMTSLDGTINRKLIVRTMKDLVAGLQIIDWQQQKGQWPHLAGIQFPEVGKDSYADVVLGLDQCDLHASLEEVRGQRDEPMARRTPRGGLV